MSKQKKSKTLKVVKTHENDQPSKKPESNKANVDLVEEIKLPTKEQVLETQKDVLDEVTREHLIKYANKIKILTKGKWFTMSSFQKLFKMPLPQSAQILLALFSEKLIAIDQRAGTNKYMVDFDKSVQLSIIAKTIKRHEKSIDDLTEARKQLDKEIKQDKEAVKKVLKTTKKAK
tara:strand:+ start:974 stop:1498 length:525 start_codon:yes stop_codon:yes gene_type:complete